MMLELTGLEVITINPFLLALYKFFLCTILLDRLAGKERCFPWLLTLIDPNDVVYWMKWLAVTFNHSSVFAQRSENNMLTLVNSFGEM